MGQAKAMGAPCPLHPYSWPSTNLVRELDVWWRVAKFPVDVHLDAPCEGCFYGLDNAHDAENRKAQF